MANSARIDELKKKFDENPRRYFAPLANEYRKAGDPDQAIAICREFLPQQPGHMSGHIVYGQALFGFLPMRDPTARLLASGFVPVAQSIDALRKETHAGAVLTTNYAPAGWLAFYLPGRPPVVQINEAYRWLAAPKAGAALLKGPLLYVTESGRDQTAIVARSFSKLRLLARLARIRGGRTVSRYDVYLVSGWRGDGAGRITNGP